MPQAANNYEPPHRKTQAQRRRQSDAQRPSAHERGYDQRWRRFRRLFLARPENALCAECKRASATVVDHIQPHKGDPELFWDESNLQALCKRCHDRKTATQDRGAWDVSTNKQLNICSDGHAAG